MPPPPGSGKHWLSIRTACEPLFHSAALEGYAPMMNAATDALVEKLGAAASSGDGECWFVVAFLHGFEVVLMAGPDGARW